MDWTRARAILLVAFTLVNLVLAYSLWGPDSNLPALGEPSHREQMEQLRARLSDRGLILPSDVLVPSTPPPMQFLRVDYLPDLTFEQLRHEYFRGSVTTEARRSGFEGTSGNPEPTLDPATRAIIYRPYAQGPAARDVNLDDQAQAREAAEQYLRQQLSLPADARVSGVFSRDGSVQVEFVPHYQGIPVYSGYLRVDLSHRGIEQVVLYWVRPVGFKEMPPKAVRPAAEALLRLAGHLERTGERTRTIVDVRLGYYSGPSVTVPVGDDVSAWDTVPVWRIALDNGLVYYVNAFNGELES